MQTTLLNLISNRVKKTGNFHCSGKVLVNGEELDPISFQRTSAYLMQDDVMFAHLTVREQVRVFVFPKATAILTFWQVYYCAKLQLKGVSDEEVRERVELLLVDLGLTGCASTLIGRAGTSDLLLLLFLLLLFSPELGSQESCEESLEASASAQQLLVNWSPTQR